MEHPKLHIIQHKDIFFNQSRLHLHQIPNLSERFLYFNDDNILDDLIYPDDFYTQSEGFKVYLSWLVPNCVDGCPLNWLKDSYCDKSCNNSRCLWDGGDCLPSNMGNNSIVMNLTSFGKIAFNNIQTIIGSESTSNHCVPNCLDNWLGDSFCDQYVQDKFQTINQLLLINLLTDHGKQHFTKRLRQLYSDLICNQTVMFENSPERKFIEMFIREVFPSNETYLTRHLLDAYADSLIYVNFLYNKAFGVQSRHVHIEPYRKWHSKNVKNRRISDQTDWC
ncbi:hypothetical protein RDWZM_007149 [Blomia tropicalis]|uniref:LNR domain-containing protein n=1 Tax=Blomia tropicalis TaxID=40697 RepID=A0A9Q0MB61_BLOTA|nr:hypothetical protein RDWZM_007149 [Blomia tropicalis]